MKVADELGISFGLTLEPEPAYTSNLHVIARFYPSRDPKLRDIVTGLRFEAPRPQTLRIACLSLDAVAAAGDGAAQDVALGKLIEGLRALGANTVVIDAGGALPSAEAPLGDVYFPTPLRPLRKDLLSRATWQIRTRGDADIFVRLPVAAAVAAVGADNLPRLFADMSHHALADGVVIDLPESHGPIDIVADHPSDIRARRDALDGDSSGGWTQLGLAAYRAAATFNPHLRLMVAMRQPDGPPDWADIGLLPSSDDAGQMVALARHLRADGWLRPDVAGRVALSLPEAPGRQIEALRLAQSLGVSAFALCPNPPALPPSPALAAAFSAATFPHRP